MFDPIQVAAAACQERGAEGARREQRHAFAVAARYPDDRGSRCARATRQPPGGAFFAPGRRRRPRSSRDCMWKSRRSYTRTFYHQQLAQLAPNLPAERRLLLPGVEERDAIKVAQGREGFGGFVLRLDPWHRVAWTQPLCLPDRALVIAIVSLPFVRSLWASRLATQTPMASRPWVRRPVSGRTWSRAIWRRMRVPTAWHCCRRHLPVWVLGRLSRSTRQSAGPALRCATRSRGNSPPKMPTCSSPAVAGTFSCVLNAPISEQATPASVLAAASHVFRCRARHVDGQGPVPAPPPLPVQLRADLHAGPRESADERRIISLGAHDHRLDVGPDPHQDRTGPSGCHRRARPRLRRKPHYLQRTLGE